MNLAKIRAYDKEFKLNAINLHLEKGRTPKQISQELGIPKSTLVSWIYTHKKEGSDSFPGKGYLKPLDVQVIHLRKELAIAREERDILKKALAIFSSLRK